MKRILGVCGLLLGVAAGAGGQMQAASDPLAPLPVDPAVKSALAGISADQVRADVEKLVSFGTRNTLSSMDTELPPGQGINAAAAWIESEFQGISAQCGGCLEVKRDEFVEPAATGPHGRVPRPTKLVNVYAILHGTGGDKAPWVLVTGHYDSRATDVMNDKLTSPGANDDASGVAVSIESARALSGLPKAGVKLTGTMVFVAVAGEEQGLYGSRHLAQLAKAEGWPLEAVLNNDIVGGDTTPGESGQDKDAVRVFSESVPATATPEQQQMMLGLGAENDSPSRELARQIAELAPSYFKPTTEPPPAMKGGMMQGGAMQGGAMCPMMKDGAMKDGAMKDGAMKDGAMKDGTMKDGTMCPMMKDGTMKDGAMKDGMSCPMMKGGMMCPMMQKTAFHPVLVLRRDRYLRGGDHSSFNAEGFAAVRFTEWRENFDHQHQTLRTESGVEFGDLLKFVDFNYVVKVARLNALTLASLAAAPSEPQDVRILTKALDNNSELTWDAAAFAPVGTTYEVVWRDTDAAQWTHSQSAGSETHLKLDVSKDNVLFGVRAVSAAGDRSLPVPPLPAR